MSVLIKGMGMPFSCTECPLVITEQISEYIDKDSEKVSPIYNCIYKPDDIEDGWIRFSKADKERQDWCPLVELPEHHGGLIDVDAACDDFDTVNPIYRYWIDWAKRCLRAEQVLVEAE